MDRVLSWPVPSDVDAEAAFAALWADSPHAFWLDSSGPTGGTSYLGSAAWAETSDSIRESGQDVLAWLRSQRARWTVDVSGTAPGFSLGIVMALGYELYEETLGIPARTPRRTPDAVFLGVDRCLAIDQTTGQARLLAKGREWAGPLAAWRDQTLAALAGLTALPTPAAGAGQVEANWRYSDQVYETLIRECQHAIADGDAYVLCLTTEVTVAGGFDPWQVYRRVRRTSPSHHGAYLRSGDLALLSASPEQFLAVDRSGWVTTKPIKGTRPRGGTEAEDERLREELRASDKERAENVMIVDLMRNDLSRVCELGTVEVTKLLDIESNPHVHSLVSTVAGRLDARRDVVDVIRSCFPAGSMTGAPKHSAVGILQRLEARSRGIYSGAFGYLGYDGALDLAMTIRSIVIDPAGAVIGTGGGITSLSDPKEETEETRLKARALLQALGG